MNDYFGVAENNTLTVHKFELTTAEKPFLF